MKFLKKDIINITVVISALLIYFDILLPNVNPSIKFVNSGYNMNVKQYGKINDSIYCSEFVLNGIFRNNIFKFGYVDSVKITPNFMNIDIIENERFIKSQVKYIDKLNIKFLQKRSINISILFFYKSPSYFKDKEFVMSFIDNYNNTIEFNDKNEPAHLYFKYFER
jgi:hypothetical protein